MKVVNAVFLSFHVGRDGWHLACAHEDFANSLPNANSFAKRAQIAFRGIKLL
jgi:hypothetical protein